MTERAPLASRTQILSAVDALKDDLFAFSQQLVRAPSLPGHEAVAQAIVADKLRTLGLDVQTVSSTRRDLEHPNPLFADPLHVAPISIGTIRGGDWHSMVPGEVVLEGRFGVLPGESIDHARRALSETLQHVSDGDAWLREHPPALEWFEGQFESGATDPHAPIVRVLSECHEAVTGRAPVLRGVTYGSDLRLFTNHAAMPAVLYGPGSVLQAHSINEFVELDDVLDATRTIALTVHSWCGDSVEHVSRA